jgi:hypothetical protein
VIGCAHENEICGGFAGVMCCLEDHTHCHMDLGTAGHCKKGIVGIPEN